MQLARLFLVLLALTIFAAYAHAQAPDLPRAVDRKVDFAADVHAILAENCAKCHGEVKPKSGLGLHTRETLLIGGESGPAAIPGNSAESLLIHLVSGKDPDRIMPPTGRRLTEQEIGILRAWIDQDLPWDLHPGGTQPLYITPLGLNPVAPPELPGETSSNPIDRFIAQYTTERGASEPAPVDDARFARRVHLDITGLLPTPAALRAFTADTAPGKRAMLVGRLLDDKQAYAEHWMSFWNDLLRNDFEGTGYIDGGRMQITTWLYDALHDNKPYDQFVRDLISGTPGAVGFIKGIVWRGDNAVVQTAPMQAARNLAQVFLGINLKCASCHDSFIDHWQLADAFNLANAFAEEPLELVRCETALGKPAGYGFLWPELGGVDGTQPREVRMARVAELTTLKENGHFARTIVNRLWAQFFGRGLVEPVDSIESEPWHPALLDTLAQDFIDHGYDLKHTIARILTSRAYAWPSLRRGETEPDTYAFAGPEVRRLSAEQFYDALSTITGVWHINAKFLLPAQRTPEEEARQKRLEDAAKVGLSALSEPGKDVPLEDYFAVARAWRVPADPLTLALGRTNREQVTTRREVQATTLQMLELSNGTTLAAHLRRGAAALLKNNPRSAADYANELYLAGAQRFPTPGERAVAEEVLGDPVTQEGLEDFLWILSVSPDFQLIF